VEELEEEQIYDVEDSEREDEDEVEDEDAELHEATAEVSRRISEGGSRAVARRRASVAKQPTSHWLLIIVAGLLMAVAIPIGQHKMDSAPIGYCETGKNTNEIVRARELERRELEGCHAQRVGDNNPDACPPLPIIPRAEACTPCPAHATCTRTEVMCDDGYVKSPHPFTLVPYLSELANGLPVLGSVAFPPRCIVDPKRRRNIGQLGRGIDVQLARFRGDRLCSGVLERADNKLDAVKWGIEVGALKELMRKSYVTPEKKGKEVSILPRWLLTMTQISSVHDNSCKARMTTNTRWKILTECSAKLLINS
jgi:hypothetical protein